VIWPFGKKKKSDSSGPKTEANIQSTDTAKPGAISKEHSPSTVAKAPAAGPAAKAGTTSKTSAPLSKAVPPSKAGTAAASPGTRSPSVGPKKVVSGTSKAPGKSAALAKLGQTAKLPKLDTINPTEIQKLRRAGRLPAEPNTKMVKVPSPEIAKTEAQAGLKKPTVIRKPPPPEAPKAPSLMFCPLCEEKMEIRKYGETNVFCCDVCGGYWCPANTIHALAGNPQSELNRLLTVKLRVLLNFRLENDIEIFTNHLCPACRQPLYIQHYKKVLGVGVEGCKDRCGVFVEKNTLEKIQILDKISF